MPRTKRSKAIWKALEIRRVDPGDAVPPGLGEREPKLNLPNIITSGRILAAPLVTALLLQPRPVPRLIAFVVFVTAALSDQ